ALTRLVAPAFGQLGAGLTPFGRPLLQPWTGALVRDAGSATVATLPLLVLGGLFLLTGALSYGIFRLAGGRAGAGAAPRGAARPEPGRFWELVRRNLPTAGRPPEDPPRDL
ncbi:MAG TPA: hypothetical protein VGE07_08720, partial [Herpetosiphonaceae bacterium]